ncbi:hypothetical protein DFJ77DRAFT_276864 [Powellomyces hirtus]|nr:hypothetical protein DFJ77DRAFT_276864 [Powellomyces hirtus]
MWTLEEDKELYERVMRHGPHWDVIQKKAFPHRTRTSLRERWHASLDPKLTRTPWTAGEEAIMLEEMAKKGKHPFVRAARVLNRYPNAVAKAYNNKYKQRIIERMKAEGNEDVSEGRKTKPSARFRRAALALAEELRALPPNTRVRRKGVEAFSPEEDAKLVRAVEEIGNNWAVIARDFPGRTENDVYNRYTDMSAIRPNPPWTAEEDAILAEGYAKYLPTGKPFYRIWENLLPHRTPDKISYRWYSLASHFNHGRWSSEEKEQLAEARRKWDKSQKLHIRLFHLPHRNSLQIRHRFRYEAQTSMDWTKSDDDRLRRLIEEHGWNFEKLWEHFPGVETYNLIGRWMNVNPALQKKKVSMKRTGYVKWIWTAEADMQLMKLRAEEGYDWPKIAIELEYPVDVVRRRFSKLTVGKCHGIPNKQVAGRWTKSEDDRLFALVDEYERNFEVIAKHFPECTPKELRDRWRHVRITQNLEKNGKVRKFVWTDEVDERLVKMVRAKRLPWGTIADELGYTIAAAKQRFQALQKERRLQKDENQNSEPIKTIDSQQSGAKAGFIWNDEADARLLEMHTKLGPRWKEIAFALGGTESGVARRYQTLTRRERASTRVEYLWTDDSDQRLLKLHNEKGRRWREIGDELGFPDYVVRYRFLRLTRH